MKGFENQVQYLKHRTLCEVAKHAFDDTLQESVLDIPKSIVPGKIPTMRCCVYKERAILGERVKLAMGGNRNNPNVIETLDIACNECPVSGYDVTPVCRGCIAHRCKEACKSDAIYLDQGQKAHIDQNKCIECGLCAKACPYHAIIQNKRPCESACKVHAISMDEEKSALVDFEKCNACGACVTQCPFGAIMDKSSILNVIALIKQRARDGKPKLYAMLAPSIATQFTDCSLGQVVSGLKALGFDAVAEAALGADMVAYEESGELAEKGLLMSSCCPAFVDFTETNFPELTKHFSSCLSPMATLGKHIKSSEPEANIVFIGPCTAKKAEAGREEVKPYIDAVITFEELRALFDSREIELADMEAEELADASGYGRAFAYSGGVSAAIRQGLNERGHEDFPLKAVRCDGIEECRIALLKLNKGLDVGNFIEGMACVGGCVGGAGCITRMATAQNAEMKASVEAGKTSIREALARVKD
ncbi:MAG TPA: monomeric [FeFe] hydrogenase [Candidatus Cryosericum sp.]|nr:monomeric [FeFe] hydrogenase [Candidatus Cryosericum sp.]